MLLKRWRDPQVAAAVLTMGAAAIFSGIGLLALDIGADHRIAAYLIGVGIPLTTAGAGLIQWGPPRVAQAVEYSSATLNSERKAKLDHMVDELVAAAERSDAKQVRREEDEFKELIRAFDDGIWLRNKFVQAIQQKVSNKRSETFFAACDTWVGKTRERVGAAMSQDEVRRFSDLSGITPAKIDGGTQKQQRYFQAIDCYMQRLGQMIDLFYESLDSKYDFGGVSPVEAPAIRVTPITDHGFRYLSVENIGGSGEFRAQVEIVEGQENWLQLEQWMPPMPYSGYWESRRPETEVVKLFQGQIGRLAIAGLLEQGSPTDRHWLPQFAHFDASGGHRFFGKRIDSLDDLERCPLVVKVTIGSLPSMTQPFVAKYRFRLNAPLEEVK